MSVCLEESACAPGVWYIVHVAYLIHAEKYIYIASYVSIWARFRSLGMHATSPGKFGWICGHARSIPICIEDDHS